MKRFILFLCVFICFADSLSRRKCIKSSGTTRKTAEEDARSRFSSLDNLKDSIKIGYFKDWDYSLVVSQFSQQLIEELLDIKVELVPVPYDGQSYVEMVNKGTIDAHLTTYSTELDFKFSSVVNLGSCGFQEWIGWYLPGYMTDMFPELVFYKGWHKVFENESFFCEHTNVSSYQPYRLEFILHNNPYCQDKTNSSAKKCIEAMKAPHSADDKCKLKFISDPDCFDFGMDSSIIKNLKLDTVLKPIYLDKSNDSVDTKKLQMFSERFEKKRPFMINAMSPSPLLATAEKEDKPMVRVTLPSFSLDCAQRFFDLDTYTEFDCDYISESIIKIANENIKTRFPGVFRFLSRFTLYQETYLNDILHLISKGSTNEDAICQFIAENDDLISLMVTQRDIYIEKRIPPGPRIAFIVISCILILYSLSQYILLFFFYQHSNIKSGSFMFLMLIVTGACLYFSWIVVLSLEPTTITCILSPWLELIGYFMVFFSLIIKSARVALLLHHKTASRVNGTRKLVSNLKDKKLFLYYSCFMTLVIVYLTIWTCVSTPVPKKHIVSVTTVDDHQQTLFEYTCSTDDKFTLIAFILQFTVLFIACLLAVLVRKLPSTFNESKFIGISVYNAFFCAITRLIVSFTKMGTEVEYILTCFFSILSILLVLILIVSLKILCAYKYDNENFIDTSIPQKSSIAAAGKTLVPKNPGTITATAINDTTDEKGKRPSANGRGGSKAPRKCPHDYDSIIVVKEGEIKYQDDFLSVSKVSSSARLNAVTPVSSSSRIVPKDDFEFEILDYNEET